MRRVLLPGLAAAVVSLAPAMASAATITVDTTAMDTTSNGNCTLYEAVTAASTNAAADACVAGDGGADTIQIPLVANGLIQLNAGAMSTPDGEPLTIEGPAPGATLTIDATTSPRIFNAGDDLTLQDMTLEGVDASSQDGGVVAGVAAVTLTDVTADGNHISVSGHGACVEAPTIVVSGSDFFSNSAQGDGGCLHGATITVSNSTFTGNSTGGAGGAIVSTASTTITDSTFGGPSTGAGNTASNGGGAIALGTGNLSISGSTFEANKSTPPATRGGAIHSSSSGTVTISDSTFGGPVLNDGNQAPAGGALAIDAGTLNASGSTFFSNQATAVSGVGGAIAFTGTGAGGSITNSTFTQNVAQGGAASVDLSTTGAVTLRHDTMRLNGSPIADIASDPSGSLTLASSIVASPFNGGTECAGTVTDGGFNDIFPSASAGACSTTGTNVTGDPDLQPLTPNGGPTDTMMLGPASAALDAIPFAQCDIAGDQRTVVRPVGGSCDIGAVEDDFMADGLIAKGAAFVGDGIYNDDGTGQTKSANVKQGHSVKFTCEAQNDAALADDTLRVTGDGGNKHFKVSYRSGGAGVTPQVTGSGYEIGPVGPGEDGLVTVKVKVVKGTHAGRHINLPITAASASLPQRSDMVAANVTAK